MAPQATSSPHDRDRTGAAATAPAAPGAERLGRDAPPAPGEDPAAELDAREDAALDGADGEVRAAVGRSRPSRDDPPPA